jgi:hypothetical protein
MRKEIHMEFVLPLDKKSTSDKLAAMERLWEDLCHTAESVQSPWHGDVLSAREKRLKEGKSKFTSFDEAKDRISKERGRTEEYKLTTDDYRFF